MVLLGIELFTMLLFVGDANRGPGYRRAFQIGLLCGKMEEGLSPWTGRVLSKIAAFGPLNAGLTFGYSTASSLSASRVTLGIIYSPLQRGCGVMTSQRLFWLRMPYLELRKTTFSFLSFKP